jgi:uncharacterized protein
MPAFLDHPLRLDGRGRVATTEADDHVRDMIYQVLFTSPGERVNRPTFGAGLQQMVFAPNSPELAAAPQFLVQGALQRWLADVVVVERVTISNEEERLVVDVVYVRLDTGQRRRDLLVSPAGGF